MRRWQPSTCGDKPFIINAPGKVKTLSVGGSLLGHKPYPQAWRAASRWCWPRAGGSGVGLRVGSGLCARVGVGVAASVAAGAGVCVCVGAGVRVQASVAAAAAAAAAAASVVLVLVPFSFFSSSLNVRTHVAERVPPCASPCCNTVDD